LEISVPALSIRRDFFAPAQNGHTALGGFFELPGAIEAQGTLESQQVVLRVDCEERDTTTRAARALRRAGPQPRFIDRIFSV
jgi:hypothetical protein